VGRSTWRYPLDLLRLGARQSSSYSSRLCTLWFPTWWAIGRKPWMDGFHIKGLSKVCWSCSFCHLRLSELRMLLSFFHALPHGAIGSTTHAIPSSTTSLTVYVGVLWQMGSHQQRTAVFIRHLSSSMACSDRCLPFWAPRIRLHEPQCTTLPQ
jgi:hypothetical protein